jgi:hypothetical protein
VGYADAFYAYWRVGPSGALKRRNSSESIPGVVYSGPLRVKNAASSEDLTTLELDITAYLTSSAGSSIANVYSTDPTPDTDWASVAAMFVEYRVLAVTIYYTPNYIGFAPAALSYAPIYVVQDRASNTPLVSYGQAASYADVAFNYLMQPWVYTCRMADQDAATFSPIGAAPLKLNFIKLWSTGLSVSQIYGNVITRHLVQFRGRS